MDTTPVAINGNSKIDEPPSGADHPILDYLPKKVAIIYSEAKREYFPTEEQYITEKSAAYEAGVVATYIQKLGIEPILIPGDENLTEALKTKGPEMAINLVESVKGHEDLAPAIPGVLEMLNIPYTGADILGLSITYNKFLTTKLLQQAGVPVPHTQLFYTYNDHLNNELQYPLITKLNAIHGGVEITRASIVENEKELQERLKFLIGTYKQPVLVQEFIVGREISAIVLQGVHTKVYMAEKVFEDSTEKYNFSNFDYQWRDDYSHGSYHYEKYNDETLKALVKKAFDATKMEDYGKVEIRIDSSGRYYVIDNNTNCAFGPKEMQVALGTILETLYGVSFTEILKRLILNTSRANPVDFNGTD